MIYGYARVSTKEQNTARQLDAFAKAGVDEVVEEKASGKDFENRSEYQKLRKRLKQGDVLMVISLDRFGRNYEEVLEEWRYLTTKKQVDIKVIDMPIIDTTTGNGLIGKVISDIVLQLLAFVAQSERERIHERQMQGIVAAKARGVKFGRPGKALPENILDLFKKVSDGEISMREAGRQSGVSKTTFHAYFYKHGFRVPDRGDKFRHKVKRGPDKKPRKRRALKDVTTKNQQKDRFGLTQEQRAAVDHVFTSVPVHERWPYTKNWTDKQRAYLNFP